MERPKEHLTYTRAQLADALGVSLRTLATMDASDAIPQAIKIGSGTRPPKRWTVAEVRDWLAAGAPSRTEWNEMRRVGA